MDVPSLANLLFCGIVLLGFLDDNCVGQKLEISAFEYNRKFGSSLDIGQCSLKIEQISPGVAVTRNCNLPNKQGPVRSVSKVLNDTRNFEVRQYNDIFVFMGLCDATTVTSLGILHKGDCFAVEIASNLTFNRKTYIRAYVEYYRRSVDIQEDGIALNPVLAQHYDGAYYLRDRSYGMLEIIVVEMKFRHAASVGLLKKSNFQSQSMSEHLKFAEREVGLPYTTKVIRISTTENKVEMTQFRKRDFTQAYKNVKRYEQDLYRIREEMYSRKPHLNYGMLPFLPKPRALGLSSGGDMLTWETATAIEIMINRGITIYKSLKRTCNRAKITTCSLLRYVKRELRSIKTVIHSKRSKWSYLPADEQVTTNKLYSGRMRRIQKEIARIRRSLKLWRVQQRKAKALKLGRRKRQKKAKNQSFRRKMTSKKNRVQIS
ncbi:uncharacterized protein LOC117342330 [Pecten maximus]|uniref:uncharacterized protein LOC117342330 n=1 Tax=Pecten maximus TaxID=6579 RepID=UPI001458C800|nr:uncharacterized protein LOC117342330 [Pecten maximus]